MQKELLLAISDDRAASYNIRYLREVYGSHFCDLKLTLFYVAPRKASYLVDKSKFVPRHEGFDELITYSSSGGDSVLKDTEQWIRNVAGCSGVNIQTKVVQSHKGTVQELITEAREGLYDALVLGRRTVTWFEEIFSNSVTHSMILSNIDFPIWVCKRPPDTLEMRHDVLLCLDGSDASLRMVDHAGFMLADELNHTFTLFHVAPNFDMGRKQRIFDEALALLAEHNIEDERIELKMVTGTNPVKATLKEAHDGNYSAVGVGKHGADANGTTKGFFPSSVTVQLLRQLEDSALWISK